MKETLGTRIAEIVSVILSIALMIFLFTVPRRYTREVTEVIISQARKAIEYTQEERYEEAETLIKEAHRLLEQSEDKLMMLYDHNTVSDLCKALEISLRLSEMEDKGAIITSLYETISYAEFLNDIEENDLSILL